MAGIQGPGIAGGGKGRPEEVKYQKLQVRPVLSDGLIAVDRDDGGPQRRVAAAFGRLADEAGQVADQYAAVESADASRRLAVEGRPGPATIASGVDPSAPLDTASPSGAVDIGSPSLSGTISSVLDRAAGRHGEDAAAMKALAWLESKGDTRAKNPRSSAGGLFQFIDGTARQYGLRNRFNAMEASDAGARLLKDNRASLRRTLSREPTAGELYLAHQQGAGGAAKLLRDPSARAVDVVGADAVRLNGGRSDMTAGEFARLWTDKADAAYQAFGGGAPEKTGSAAAIERQITPESVAAPSITPVSITPGQAGSWRPKSNLTISGRAWNAAGTETYLQQLNATMRQDVDAVYDRFKDDPAQLQAAFGELRTAHLNEHVFPEIEGDYDARYADLTGRYLRQARDDQEVRVKQGNLADFMERAQDIETRAAQDAARFTGENASEAVQDNLSAIGNAYDSAVAHGLITAPEAVKAKAAAGRRMAVAFYSKQGQSLQDPTAIDALRSKMQADFGDGKLVGVDAEGMEQIDRSLEQAAAAAARKGVAAAKAYGDRADDMATAFARGGNVDWGEIGRFTLDAGSAPGGQEIVRKAMERMALGKQLAGSSVDEADDLASEKERHPSAIADGSAAFARREADHAAAMFRKDPIGYGVRQGLIEEGPAIDPASDPNALAAALTERERSVAALRGSGAEYADVGLLRPTEAEAVGALWRNGTPEQIKAFTDSLVTVSPAIYRATLEQPEVKKALTGAATSNDPNRNFEAMKQLDALAAGSGLGEVERLFSGDALDRLQDWQVLSRYYTPEEAADWLKRRNDPRWREQIQPRQTEGRKKARDMSINDVASDLGAGGWFGPASPIDGVTQRAMKTDFDAIYADRYASTGDEGASRSQTIERMKANGWGVSGALGRIMFQPPERYYPAIGNSTDWIRDQLSEDVKAHGGTNDTTTLIADQKTLSQIQKRQPPSYQIRIVDPKTGFDDVIRDGSGAPLSWSPDPTKVTGAALDRAKAKRKSADDLARDQATGADRDQALDDFLAGPLGNEGAR